LAYSRCQPTAPAKLSRRETRRWFSFMPPFVVGGGRVLAELSCRFRTFGHGPRERRPPTFQQTPQAPADPRPLGEQRTKSPSRLDPPGVARRSAGLSPSPTRLAGVG